MGDQNETLDCVIDAAGCRLCSRKFAPASAVIYCQYVDYPAGCAVRAGAVLRPRPVARAVVTQVLVRRERQ